VHRGEKEYLDNVWRKLEKALEKQETDILAIQEARQQLAAAQSETKLSLIKHRELQEKYRKDLKDDQKCMDRERHNERVRVKTEREEVDTERAQLGEERARLEEDRVHLEKNRKDRNECNDDNERARLSNERARQSVERLRMQKNREDDKVALHQRSQVIVDFKFRTQRERKQLLQEIKGLQQEREEFEKECGEQKNRCASSFPLMSMCGTTKY
jgi:hypothetical protein